MKQLPWTKFQDFYLRLGFLKVLVAAISPDRRSASNNTIVLRVLVSPLSNELTRVGNGAGTRRRMPGDALLTGVKTRKAS